MALCLLTVLLAIFLPSSLSTAEFYDEELILIPHGDSVVAHFNFVVEVPSAKASLEGTRDFELLAKQLGAAIADHDVLEMHLSLTRGEWRQSLGYPISSSPTGAELWAWFGNDSKAQTDEKWKGVLHVLSAIYCTSLQQLVNEATSSQLAFKPTGVVPRDITKLPLKYLRYGAIARETLCTENLAPSKNLLPCSGNSGLGSLLNPLRLFDSEFNSLQLHVRHVARPIGDGGESQLVVEVRQSVTAVFALYDAEKRPDSVTFSLKGLFDKAIMERCYAARRSTILVDVTHFRANSNDSAQLDGVEFTPSPSFLSELQIGSFKRGEGREKRLFAAFELHGDAFDPSRDAFFNLKAVLKFANRAEGDVNRFFARRTVPLATHRFLTGFGQNRNGIKSFLRNRLKSEALLVSYFETLPWFARIAFSSLRVELQKDSNDSAPLEPYSVETLHLLPGVDRARPHRFELILRVPARATVAISYEFEKAALRWFEYPPDPNHGFYLPASVVSFTVPTSAVGSSKAYVDQTVDSHFYHQISSNFSSLTEQLLATSDGKQTNAATVDSVFQRVHTHIVNFAVATPDFSMPFNVICLTSTVVAIAFGSFHNLTTRSFALVDPKRKSLKQRLGAIFAKLTQKRTATDSDCAPSASVDKPKTE